MLPKAPAPGVPGLPEEMSFPGKEMEPCDWEQGSWGLWGRGSGQRGDVLPLGHPTLCQGMWAGAAAPWPRCPLVSPPDPGHGAVSWWLWGGALSPTRPLRLREPKPWQGQTCQDLAAFWLLWGLTPHSKWGTWPPEGQPRRPGALQLLGRTMACPCPGPSPRDNNGRSRSCLSSSPH